MVLAYTPTETVAGAISPVICFVREEINKEFELELVHPKDDYGKWARIVRDSIIEVDTYRGQQKFRIYSVSIDPITGTVLARGRHIFYDLANNLIEDTRPTDATAEEAGQALLTGCQFASGFSFSSVMTNLATAYYIRQNPVYAMIGDGDNAMVKRWGGEIYRDNYDITWKDRLGADNGMRIKYAKNLTGLVADEDASGIVTRIMPVAVGETNAALLLPEKYIDSTRIEDYPIPRISVLDCRDIRVGETVDEEIPYPDLDSAYTEMRLRVAEAYAAEVDLPKITLDVTFVDLARTEEYKDYQSLVTVTLGDTVTVEYAPLSILKVLRVRSVEYDCLTGMFTQIRLGDAVPNIATKLIDLGSLIETERLLTTRQVQESEKYLADALLTLNRTVSASIGYYTTTITNEHGAMITYMHDHPTLEESLYIAIEAAPGTFAWTTSGWNDGSPAWTYGITQDGSAIFRLLTVWGINADWINAGSINTDLILVGSQTLTEALAGITSDISALSGGGTNYIQNSAWGTYDSPSLYWWNNALTWLVLEKRIDTWVEFEANIATWAIFEAYTW